MGAKILSKPFLASAAALAVAAGISGYVWYEQHRPAVLEIYVFSLKSGRSIFIRTPDDKRILIDGGANSEVISHLTRILPFYSRRIDTLIATDTNGKNMSGLIDVFNRYRVDRVIVPAITLRSLGLASTTDPAYQTFIDTVNRERVPLIETKIGEKIIFDPGNIHENREPVTAEILFPAESDKFAYSKASSPQLVMNISYGSTSVLLLGDVSPKIQKFIAKQATTSADVLVVSDSASSANIAKEFVNEVRPAYLIYSKSIVAKKVNVKNKKDDLFLSILDDQRLNLKEQGTIKIISNGEILKISPLSN